MSYEPCNYCMVTPFNKYDLEYGGYCDKPDGSRGWACDQCFSKRYRPKFDWEIPNWAIKFVQNHEANQCLEQLCSYLFRIGAYPPITGFNDQRREAEYLRAEMGYRMEVNKVLSNIPSDPYMIHISKEPLAKLLDARNERLFKYRELHEHEIRGALHYPWMALSIGRAMEKLLETSVWTRLPNRRIWSGTIGPWKLGVWEEPDSKGWRWQASSAEDRAKNPTREFRGMELDEESAKNAAEQKARTSINTPIGPD